MNPSIQSTTVIPQGNRAQRRAVQREQKKAIKKATKRAVKLGLPSSSAVTMATDFSPHHLTPSTMTLFCTPAMTIKEVTLLSQQNLPSSPTSSSSILSLGELAPITEPEPAVATMHEDLVIVDQITMDIEAMENNDHLETQDENDSDTIVYSPIALISTNNPNQAYGNNETLVESDTGDTEILAPLLCQADITQATLPLDQQRNSDADKGTEEAVSDTTSLLKRSSFFLSPTHSLNNIKTITKNHHHDDSLPSITSSYINSSSATIQFLGEKGGLSEETLVAKKKSKKFQKVLTSLRNKKKKGSDTEKVTNTSKKSWQFWKKRKQTLVDI